MLFVLDQSLFKGDLTTMPGTFSDRETKHSVLENTKDISGNLHVILATKSEYVDRYGVAIHYYGDSGDGWTDRQCFRGASGQSSIEYIKRVGCYVWMDIIKETTFASSSWTTNKAAAYILAHEIGHALGISSHVEDNTTSPMRVPEFDNVLFTWDSINKFDGVETSRSSKDAINLREVIGIHTIAVGL